MSFASSYSRRSPFFPQLFRLERVTRPCYSLSLYLATLRLVRGERKRSRWSRCSPSDRAVEGRYRYLDTLQRVDLPLSIVAGSRTAASHHCHSVNTLCPVKRTKPAGRRAEWRCPIHASLLLSCPQPLAPSLPPEDMLPFTSPSFEHTSVPCFESPSFGSRSA